MLAVDPKMRPSIEALLAHPWMTEQSMPVRDQVRHAQKVLSIESPLIISPDIEETIDHLTGQARKRPRLRGSISNVPESELEESKEEPAGKSGSQPDTGKPLHLDVYNSLVHKVTLEV